MNTVSDRYRLSHSVRLAATSSALSLVLMLGIIAGCALDDHPVVYIKNGTAISVEVVLLHDGGSESLVDDELPPGGAVTYNRMANCVEGVLVARDVDGQEVARSARPVCRPSEWLITLPPSPSP